ncbi:hypothetical protein GCM10018781_37820 [Kitasatospora indigofera]|uniref:Anaphase-promoting complex subunit 4 WD40 domain-containing protein n=1 Tax=Kitasatospora indigofera TaxID=67307 RepID=A0A919FW62_9ACTN|nr:WD40 repeat domain-containing protein [Kitasatospora indigofera]GHH73446.1 hypothetical protein GCM10018781_37820 [Kitasatospora indigofera]
MTEHSPGAGAGRPRNRPAAPVPPQRLDIDRGIVGGRDLAGVFVTGDNATVHHEHHVHLPPRPAVRPGPDGGAVPRDRTAKRPAEDAGGQPAQLSGRTLGFVLLGILLVIGAIVSGLDDPAPEGAVPASLASLDDLESTEALAFAPDGRTLTVTGGNGVTRIWDPGTRRTTPALPDPLPGTAGGVLLSADGRTLAGADGNKVRLTEVATGRTPATLTHGNFLQNVTAMAFSPDGRTLATAGGDDRIRGWEVATGRPAFTLARAPHTTALAFSPDGTVLAGVGGPPDGGADGGSVRFWNTATGVLLTSLAQHENGYAGSAAFSPDGLTLAFSAGRVVRFVDVAQGRLGDGRLTGHSRDINDLAFGRDGRTLATAGGDRTVRLWNLSSGRTFATLTEHDGAVRDLAFSPDGLLLATAGADRTARLWTVPCFSPDLLVTASASPGGRPAPRPTATACAPAPTHRTDHDG